MANVLLAGPNYVDATFFTVSFSGGAWQAGLPLTNLRDPQLAVVARSTNATLAATQFDVDLGTQRLVKALAIPFSNCSRSATYRIRSSTAAGSFVAPDLVTDSGWLDVYPIIYPWGTTLYGSASWWDGRMSPEEAAVSRMPIIQVFASPPIARYWRIEIADTSNPDGYIEIPRLVLAAGWQGSLNMAVGSGLGAETLTGSVRSLSGASFFDRREAARTAKIVFNFLPEDEAMASAFDLIRTIGIDQQLFFAWNPDDTVHRHRRSFLATLSQLASVESSTPDRFAASFELKEVMP
ncbi:MAG: hypothetical protein J0H82_25935 [Alphaproteobacteria bacterium]|jgi:hypothetical protein|nr:hypothetical protein [Alphaproteobacteria bacterium]